MFEIAIASVFIAVAFVAVGTSSRSSAPATAMVVQPLIENGMDEVLSDLPCPWCLAQTDEDDSWCPSCGQPFG
jgi:hypothetical protein